MKTIMYFVADDGTRFENEEECVRYERMTKSNSFKNEISFYDADRKPISLNENFDAVFFILIKSLRAAQWLIELCYDKGYVSPLECRGVKPGLYWWDDESVGWCCWEEENNKLKDLAKHFRLFE